MLAFPPNKATPSYILGYLKRLHLEDMCNYFYLLYLYYFC